MGQDCQGRGFSGHLQPPEGEIKFLVFIVELNCFLFQQLSPDLSTLSDSWNQQPQDPSFCSGKFSARSTSFGGVNNTRDENFSDFATVPSFQVRFGYL